MRTRQGGAGGFLIGVIVLFAIAAIIATLVYLQGRSQVDRSTRAAQRFAAIKTALTQFAAVQGRLPCPANPTADTGAAEPDAASAACTYPAGTVPWKTLGIRRDDAIDSWGWKISYRVYTGAGSLTQADGVSMVNCDTVQPVSLGTDASGLCRTTRDTLESEFLAGKGLPINWFGSAITGAAFILVSHGPSGRGGYTSGSPSVQTTPLPSSANELANLGTAGPFVATNPTMASVSPDDAAHFDDVLDYMKLSEVVRLSGRTARDWPDTGETNVTLDTPTLTSALGSTPTYGDLGTSTLNVGGSRVTGLTSGGTQNLSFDSSGGTEGLGGATGGNNLSSGQNEGLRVELNAKVSKFGATLNHFGQTTVPGPLRERARFDFYNDTTLVSSTTVEACRGGNGLASFTFDLGALEFTKVEIWPVAHMLGATTLADSEFFLAAFKSCTTAPCQTALHETSNACP